MKITKINLRHKTSGNMIAFDMIAEVDDAWIVFSHEHAGLGICWKWEWDLVPCHTTAKTPGASNDVNMTVSDKASIEDIVRRSSLVAAFRQQCEAEIDARVARYLRAEHHPIVPDSWFAPASSECISLFTDGHFYGCISLCQAVGEALIRFMCQCNQFHPEPDFEANVRTLKRRKFIDEKFENLCSCLWEYRHDYHHMNKGIQTDRQLLEQIALTKIRTLTELEKWVFQYSDTQGCITPRWPKYWPDPKDGKCQVYLRLSP